MASGTDKEKGWRRFQKLSFDKKQTLKRIRKVEITSMRHAHKFILRRWRNVRDVRRIVIIWAVAVGCLIGAAGLQLSWDRQSYQTEAGAKGSTYAEAAIGPIDTLNPLFADSPAEDAVSQLLFSRILTYDATGSLSYDLAKNIQVSDSRLVYKVDLRDDVRWHDGRALTADDVVFTVNLLKDPMTRTQIRGWDSIAVEKRGDYTVEFTLESAYAPFESALATFPILPKHILGNIAHESVREDKFSNDPIGSGPFSFRLLQDIDTASGRRFVHLAANKYYYKGVPKLAKVQILAVPDEAAMIKALRLNEVNGATGLTRTGAGSLPEKRYVAATQAVQGGVYALLNNDSEILSDKKVRKALQRATNTDEIRKKLGAEIPAMPLPYTDLQIHGNVPKVPSFDIKAARTLLDEAGWKLDGNARKKDGKELRLSVVTTKNNEYERALESLIGQWRQLGIIIDEKTIDASDPTQNFVQSVLQPRAYDVLIYQLTIGRDPDVFAYWHSSQAVARGLNLSNYSSELADDILASARTSKSPALRNAKHLAFARQWIDDAPAIGLYQSTVTSVTTNSVRGINQNDILVSPDQRYSSILYWTVGSRTVYKTP